MLRNTHREYINYLMYNIFYGQQSTFLFENVNKLPLKFIHKVPIKLAGILPSSQMNTDARRTSLLKKLLNTTFKSTTWHLIRRFYKINTNTKETLLKRTQEFSMGFSKRTTSCIIDFSSMRKDISMSSLASATASSKKGSSE